MEDERSDDEQNLLLKDVEKAIEALGGPQKGGSAVLNLQELAGNPTDCAKVQMGLAFAINSLFYCKFLSRNYTLCFVESKQTFFV